MPLKSHQIAHDRSSATFSVLAARLACAALLLVAGALHADELLPGEFARIDLGRPLIHPGRFPTVRELREAVRKTPIQPVMMFKLFGNDKNHHLPIWSDDGRRLAFQRSEVDVRSSKLLLYSSLALPEPQSLTSDADVYDYMFRWTLNSTGGYAFVRVRSNASGSRIFVCGEGAKAEPRGAEGRHYGFPAAYRRTDGICRLVYEQDGQVMQQAWNAQGSIEDPLLVVRGSSPRWSRDGSRLLLARQRLGGGPASFDIVVWSLRNSKETLLPAGFLAIVRTPTWSPDEQLAAFYLREPGDGKPWRIRVCSTAGHADGITLGTDVVVNATFDSGDLAWEPSSARVWFFSNEHRREAYYPLVAADVRTGQVSVIDYPSRCTTPNDLAINPASTVPEVAFVAHDGLPQDLFILFMNHY